MVDGVAQVLQVGDHVGELLAGLLQLFYLLVERVQNPGHFAVFGQDLIHAGDGKSLELYVVHSAENLFLHHRVAEGDAVHNRRFNLERTAAVLSAIDGLRAVNEA